MSKRHAAARGTTDRWLGAAITAVVLAAYAGPSLGELYDQLRDSASVTEQNIWCYQRAAAGERKDCMREAERLVDERERRLNGHVSRGW